MDPKRVCSRGVGLKWVAPGEGGEKGPKGWALRDGPWGWVSGVSQNNRYFFLKSPVVQKPKKLALLSQIPDGKEAEKIEILSGCKKMDTFSPKSPYIE